MKQKDELVHVNCQLHKEYKETVEDRIENKILFMFNFMTLCFLSRT